MTNTDYILIFDERSFEAVSEIIFLVNKKAGFKSARAVCDHMVKTAQEVFHSDPTGRVSTAGYALHTTYEDEGAQLVQADIAGDILGREVLAFVRAGVAASDALRPVDRNNTADEAED